MIRLEAYRKSNRVEFPQDLLEICDEMDKYLIKQEKSIKAFDKYFIDSEYRENITPVSEAVGLAIFAATIVFIVAIIAAVTKFFKKISNSISSKSSNKTSSTSTVSKKPENDTTTKGAKNHNNIPSSSDVNSGTFTKTDLNPNCAIIFKEHRGLKNKSGEAIGYQISDYKGNSANTYNNVVIEYNPEVDSVANNFRDVFEISKKAALIIADAKKVILGYDNSFNNITRGINQKLDKSDHIFNNMLCIQDTNNTIKNNFWRAMKISTGEIDTTKIIDRELHIIPRNIKYGDLSNNSEFAKTTGMVMKDEYNSTINILKMQQKIVEDLEKATNTDTTYIGIIKPMLQNIKGLCSIIETIYMRTTSQINKAIHEYMYISFKVELELKNVTIKI